MYTLNIIHTVYIRVTRALSVTAAATPAQNESSNQLSAGQMYGDVSAAIALLPRAYSAGAGDHFYTTNTVKMANAAANLGYSFEGITCHVLASAIEEADNAANTYGYTNEGITAYICPSQIRYSGTSPRAVGHFYTTSKSERDNAITNLGYVDKALLAT